MAKLILTTSVSVDGYFEGPNKDIDWGMVDEEVHTFMNNSLRGSGAFLSGRISYELMEGFWPTADEDPSSPESIIDFAAIWRETPKVVYTRTLEAVGPGATIFREVDPEQIEVMKATLSGDLIVGGGQLASALIDHDLVDEFWMYVHPVVLGEGMPPFKDTSRRIPLKLVETVRFGNGVVLLKYERSHESHEDRRP